jgi:hypothetical protein
MLADQDATGRRLTRRTRMMNRKDRVNKDLTTHQRARRYHNGAHSTYWIPWTAIHIRSFTN